MKRASPSKGVIDPKLNVITYAKQCERGGAAALSVLTDQMYFQGSYDDLCLARVATILPVLRKDFLIDEYQVYESAAMGADAVLLIVRILKPALLKDLLTLTHDLGMEALVEVHDEKDAEIVAKTGARLVGINNRDLTTFDTDIGTAVKIRSFLNPDQVPVALSGIFSRQDILQTAEAGVFNFLIGESIVRSDNPRRTIGVYLGKAVV